jgi:MFS transporter, DHA1 family, multidrug resistance protein
MNVAQPPTRPAAPHVLTLVSIAAIGPLAMNVFLPSMPGMARYFDADYRVIQLLVSLYLVAIAVTQLVIGPLSDRYGRRPVLLGGLGIFALSTIAAVFSPNVETLLICRLFQSTAAAGMVLSRAVVRDTVASLDDAASRIGYITMGMSVMPMVAPIIGGVLEETYGWKSSFLLTFGITLIVLVIAFFNLRETNQNRSKSMIAQLKTYPELFRSRRFWGYALTAGFASGAFFAFLGGGPYVASELLGMKPSDYGLYFAIISLGYMFGNYISGRFSKSGGVNRMMLIGNIFGVVGVLMAIGLFAAGIMHPMSLFGPTALIGIGNGMVLPNSNAGMVSVRPHLAGSASGLGGTFQIGVGAVLAFIAGALLSPQSGPMPLLWVMLFSLVMAVFSTTYVIYVARQLGKQD